LQPDFGRCDVRKLRYRQGRDGNCADDDHKDRDDHRHNGPFDEEFGHDSFSFCALRVVGDHLTSPLNGFVCTVIPGLRFGGTSTTTRFTGIESTLEDNIEVMLPGAYRPLLAFHLPFHGGQ
jgi:hypothetical protein